jgi:hypothetical protein
MSMLYLEVSIIFLNQRKMPPGGQLKAAGRNSKAIRELNGMIYERSCAQHSHRNGWGFDPAIYLSADRKT